MFGFVPDMMMVCGCVGVVVVNVFFLFFSFFFSPIKTVDRRTAVDKWTAVDGQTAVDGRTAVDRQMVGRRTDG